MIFLKTKIAQKPMMSTVSKIMFGIGSLGFCMVAQTATSLLMFFGTVAHLMPGTLMGIAMLIGTIWDGGSDPIFGALSDRAKSKIFGRRHGFMFFGMFGVALVNIMLWSLPLTFPIWLKFIWFVVFILLFQTFNTIFQTPYQALGVELASSYDDRSSLEVYKTIFFLIGMIIPTVLLAVIFKDKTNVEQYQTMAYIGSCIMLISSALAFMGTYNQMPRLNIKARTGKIEKKSFVNVFLDFFKSFKIKNFRALVVGYSISLMSAAFLTSIGLHFFQYTFGLDFFETAIMLGALFLMTILSQPFWMIISRKIEKKGALILGISIGLVGVLYESFIFVSYYYFYTIGASSLLGYLIVGMLITGFGVGAIFSMPNSMMGDLIAVEQYRTGINKTGTYNSFMTFAYKLSQSFSAFLAGIMLDIIGFDASKQMSQTVFASLGWLVLGGVFLVLCISIVFFVQYGITKKDVKEITIKLSED
ncbi:MAG: MFS transporter [Clostridiales bacterium]|nr:MFS transporter [Clostridiales bacterium]